MTTKTLSSSYTIDRLQRSGDRILASLAEAGTQDEARACLVEWASRLQFETVGSQGDSDAPATHVVRDCARALRGMCHLRSDANSGFSVVQALWDVARGQPRDDLGPGFLAEMTHLFDGLAGRATGLPEVAEDADEGPPLQGRAAALKRSDELDRLWDRVEATMARYEDGLSPEAIARREKRRREIQDALGASDADFADWNWQVRQIAKDAPSLERLVPLADDERQAILSGRAGGLPFGVTPYYASLMDDAPGSGRDRAIRAQVIPPADYVERMRADRENRGCAFDFMLERDTSPVDLVTRRYPAIAILKPFNTCPQICVYCQRNWEIDDAMAGGALASPEAIDGALAYLSDHPAIREVLVTGGDPLGLSDEDLLPILRRVADLPHVEVIRIGTRTPVTLPSRITPALAEALGALRVPGRREVCVVTHVEHPYEVTPDLVQAVDRLRRQGIAVFNQLVYTFYVSRRFEAAKLRLLLRRAGIDPYYTFLPKGKEETRNYRVPVARLSQEQKEEARLLPGSRRTDEAVYNVPGLGKNYLRAAQHRDLIGVLADGSRVYEFHPWEKGVASRASYVGTDTPILDYLERLQQIGEDPDEYAGIWYYY